MATNPSLGLGPRLGYQMYRTPPTFKKNLQQMANELEIAVTTCCPNMVKPYNKLPVLALRWQNDDMGMDGLERELLDEFRLGWKFITKSFVIPDGPSASVVGALVQNELKKFKLKYDHLETLVIITYSGHGLGSSDYQQYHISLAMKTAGEVEFFAASGLWEMAGDELHTSFTRRLIHILRSNRRSTSFGDIFGKMAADHPNKELKAMPLYFPRRNLQYIQLMLVQLAGQYVQSDETVSLEKRKAKLQSQTADAPRILVSVQLQDSITLPDLDAWKKRLAQDLQLNSMGIEALFESTSHLLH